MKKVSLRFFFICVVLSVGVSLRLIFSSLGFNYDMESYQIVAKIVSAGGNIYAETTRYNYGPIWFILLGFIYKFSMFFHDSFLVFRFGITLLLILVDLSLWYIMYRKFSLKSSIIFFLCPISIIITGYYSQFDNLGFLIGAAAVILLEKSQKNKVDSKFIIGVCMLGISLMTKHIFFALPLWLFFSESNLKKKLLLLVIPIGLFGIGFVPFLPAGFMGIKNNVFLYTSFNNAPLWQSVVPDYLKRLVRKELFFFGSLLLGAVVFRRKKPLEQLMFYSITLVTFSSAISEQYFSIVVPFISIFINIFFVAFILLQSLFFLLVLQGGDVNWYGFLLDRSSFGFTIQLVLLLSGFIYVLYREYFPRYVLRHIVVFLIVLNSIVYLGLIVPSWREDKEMEPIVTAIREGDYEKANTLYSRIESNPPFAGSRYYEKLSTIRFNIHFYRSYRYALDGYQNRSLTRDWKKVKKDLQIVPPYFPEKEQVQLIIKYAEQIE